MRPFPLILPVYMYRIDCLLAVWTAERPAIGSGHHLINALNASSIQSHCITTAGWRDGLIMNTQRSWGRSAQSKCLLWCVDSPADLFTNPFISWWFCTWRSHVKFLYYILQHKATPRGRKLSKVIKPLSSGDFRLQIQNSKAYKVQTGGV